MTTSDDSKFLVAFVTNILLAILFLTLFVISRWFFPKVYQYRCDNSANAPPTPPQNLFGWLMITLKYKDEDMYRTHGLDAVMFIKFIKMLLSIVVGISIYGFCVLFAINATGENANDSSDDVYGLNTLTMSAVHPQSNRLVAHFFSIIFNSLMVYYFTYKMYREYMLLRFKWKTTAERIDNFAVMIREVPLNLSDKYLEEFFNRLFPGKVLSVIRSYHTPALDGNIEKRNKEIAQVEHFYAIYETTGERPIDKDKFLIGNKVDGIEYHTKRFNHYTEKINKMQKKPWPRGNLVFVVFNDMVAAAECSQVLLDAQSSCGAEQAPEPRDIIWNHVAIGHHEFMIRKLFINTFFFFLCFFWAIPVTFVSSLSNLDTLSKVDGFGFLVGLLKLSPVITGFVQGFLPTLALTIFFALLLKIITFAVTQTGIYTYSKASRGVTTKYFAFQIVNVLLVYTISGSIFGVINKLGSSGFITIINLLATSLPQQSGFFINYVMLLSLSGHTKDLWNPGFLIVSHLKKKFLAKSPREVRDAENPGGFNYPQYYVNHLLVFTILLTYSTLAPFIMIFGLIYFCLAFLSNKYNLMYVASTGFEGGGQHWIDVFHRMMVGTFIYQLLLIGVFGVYRFIPGVVIAIIMAITTLTFTWYVRQQFLRSVRNTPLLALHIMEDADSDGVSVAKVDGTAPKSDGIAPKSDGTIAKIDVHPEEAPNKPKTQVTNVNATAYYYQPSLVPLADEPQLGSHPKKSLKSTTERLQDEEMEIVVRSSPSPRLSSPKLTSPKLGLGRRPSRVQDEERMEIKNSMDSSGEGDD
jgi:hypothetical protein